MENKKILIISKNIYLKDKMTMKSNLNNFMKVINI